MILLKDNYIILFCYFKYIFVMLYFCLLKFLEIFSCCELKGKVLMKFILIKYKSK